MILMDTFCERFVMTDVGVASEAGMVVAFFKNLCAHGEMILQNGGEFHESHKSCIYVLEDEESKGKPLTWLHKHA